MTDLPVIVAGPILRRLTRSSVSVWLACTEPDPITLRVRLRGGGSPPPATQVTVTPTQVGRRLWMTVLTAPAPGGAFTAGQAYEYELTGPWESARPVDWPSVSLPGATRPTFLAPPATVAELVLLHTSCRKAHGGGRDGLALAADVLATRFAASPQAQPHLLIMSGDQIYADEVGHPLVPRLRRVATDLVAIDERDVFGTFPLIGGRGSATTGFGFTGATANHLWTYGEFLAMYLLEWSPVLWPPGGVPTFPGAAIPPEVDPGVSEESWDHDRANLVRFRSVLPAVRRVLANVPSLMTFDDHEVTDDWNLDLGWVNAVYPNPGGRRVVTNGLLAVALCQTWGNDPRPFGVAGSPEASLLGVVRSSVAASISPAPTAAPLLGVPIAALPDPPPPRALRDLSAANAIRYDLTIGPPEGWPARFILLDERTAREFTRVDSRAARISRAGLALQVPPPQSPVPLTIVVTPAPVLGSELVEDVIQPLVGFLPGGTTFADFESWSAARANHEDLLERLAAHHPVVILSGDVHYGFTAKLTRRQNGATTAAAQLTGSAAKNVEIKNAAISMFSELIMRLGLERSRDMSGYESLSAANRAKLNVPPPAGSVLPWDDAVDVLLGRVVREATSEPTAMPGPTAAAYGLPTPDWTYRIEPVDDAEPGFQAAQVQPPWAGWRPEDSLAMAEALQQADLHRMGRMFAGLPQLALIGFAVAGSSVTVRHELRCPVGGGDGNPPHHVLATEVVLS